jgi:uncharacterized protein (DUF58 family)
MKAEKTFRRAVALGLSVAVSLGAPGGRAYEAAAQTFAREAAVEAAGTAGAVPPATPVSVGVAPLSAITLSRLTLQGTPSAATPLIAAPLAAPLAAEAAAVPSAPAMDAASAPAVGAASVATTNGEIVSAAASAHGMAVVGAAPARSVSALHAVASAAALKDAASAGSVFDGAVARPASSDFVSAAAATLRAGLRRTGILARAAGALALAVGLAASPARLGAQAATPTAIQQTSAPAQAAAAAPAPTQAQEAEAPLPRPLVATLSVDRADATVGERIHLTLTLRNPTAASITVSGLRESLKDALPDDLEIEGNGAEPALTLAPGETKTVVYEAIPFASGQIPIKDAVADVSVAPAAAYPDGIEIPLPNTNVVVKSVLTPDWKKQGLRDIVDVVRARSSNWTWIAGGAFGLLLLIGLERILAARRWYPKLDERRLSLVASTEAELARLENEAATLSGAEFHAAVQEAVTRFMVDFAGLPRRERSAQILARDLKTSKAFRPEQVLLAAEIAARAETARFSGIDEDEAGRRRELARLRLLVENVGAKAKVPAPASRADLNAVFGAADLQFGSPWALLLFIPFLAYLWKAWRARGAGERFAVSSAAQASEHRSWRERLAALPRAARLSATALIILALGRPMIGVHRLESYTPSTDTMIIEDRSGSMDDKMGAGTKLDAAAAAIRAYVNEQRKGTQNRVGMETFNDVPYVDVRLTTDYDALISHLQEIKADGSTAIGEAILTGVGHFAEVNLMDLEDASDPRIAAMKTLLRRKGLGAALDYAKAYPDLMNKVLRPDRAKVVVLFTDGESNTGVDPLEAAKIAASLGVKVYTVGVGDQFDEKTLRGVAETTKAQFYKAGDVDRMTQVLIEISRLEKSPSKIVSSVSINDYTAFLALLAFLLLGAEAVLGNTRLRTLQGLIFAVSLQGLPLVRTPSPASFAQGATSGVDAGGRTAVPPEMAEGNRLYAQGLYADAVKKYAEAVAAHPDLPELYFNMADAYLRLGDVERAEQAYNKYLSLTPDRVKQSQALFNMGDAELLRKDADKAVEFYKEALRRDPNNQDAKWNLEALKKQQQEQQQNQKPGQKKGKRGQKGPPQNAPGQPGDQKGPPGQPGDQKGDPQDAAKDPKGDPKKGAEQLASKLGDQQSRQDEAARKAITRNGTGVWAALALPLAGLAGHGVLFASPALLAAAVLGVPLAALLIWYGLRRNAKAARELAPSAAPKSVGSWWGLRRHLFKSALFLGALGLIGLAATDPRGGATDQRVNFGGKDLVVAVDGSYSFIYAEDGRMAEAKKDLTQFIARLQGTDRVGLVVFSGDARTASPISIDYGNFEFKVNRLELESRGLKEGSDLGAAVAFATRSFDNAKRVGDRQRVLIVVSDGEAFSSEIETAIKAANEHNVTIYAIGIGTAAGTKMKVPTLDGNGTEYLTDSKTGAPAVTHLVESTLRRLAESTGGEYFHADQSMTIDKVMEAVARREKGRQGDTIKSPQPIGTYLLWPALALLLLDLLLPGRSLLRRDVPVKIAGETGKSGGRASLMGAALIPLAAWPQILPFAILGAVVAALLAYDVWNDGAVTRGVREAWQRRTGFVAKGVLADLVPLYDLREADAPRLAAFVARWRAANDKTRAGLIEEAAADEGLWREKLSAAYLSGAGPDVHEAVLSELRRTSRARLEPLNPVVGRIAARRGELAWLAHADAESRLAALEETASDQPFAVPLPPAPAPTARSLRARLGRSAAAGALIVSVGIGALSVDGTLRFAREQAAAKRTAFQIFYGDDLYIFSDHYIDDRIPQYVLPVLRAWNKPVRDAGPDFERAMQILRDSPDPKADNLLVVAFRRAGLLPMDQAAETILLKALIERDSDALWASMDRTIAQSGDDPVQAELLIKLVALGAEVGSDHAFMNLFRVLKSPNEQVRGMTFETLYSAMASAPSSSPFYPRLSAIGKRFAADPSLQMWSAVFGLRRAGAPDAARLDGEQMRAFFDQLIANAEAFDAGRPPLFAAALAQAKQSGQNPQLPPAFMPALINLMDKFEAQEQGQDAAASVPATSAAVVRYVMSRYVADLVKEGEKNFPDLHALLLKDGVVLPDTQAWGSDDDGDVPMGWESSFGGGYGGSYSMPQYREVYKLGHLRALQADLAAAAQAFHSDDAQKALTAAEFVDRAQAALKSALSAGARAGMPEGDSPQEKLADELLPLLKDGSKSFSGADFLIVLRAKGLAPALGDSSSALAYPQAIDAAQLTALRGLLADMAKTGKLTGAGRDLSWAEKQFVVRGLDGVDAIRREQDPSMTPAPAADDFERPDQDAVAAARLLQAVEAHAADGEDLLGLEKRLLARLAGPRSATMSAEDLKQVLPPLIKDLNNAGKGAEGWALFQRALNEGRLPAAAKDALRPQSFAALQAFGEELEKGFGDQHADERLVEADLKTGSSDWRSEFTLRQYDALASIARDVAAEAAKSPGGLNASQTDLVARIARGIPAMKAVAAKLGVPPGDPATRDTNNLYKSLHSLYISMPGTEFLDAMIQKGFAIGGKYDRTNSWPASYSTPQLKALHAELQATLAGGKWRGASGVKDLSDQDKFYLRLAIKSADAIVAARAKAAATPLHGLASIGFLVAGSAFGHWVLAALGAAVATWLIWKYAFRTDPPAVSSEEGRSASVEARRSRIAFAARRLANSVVAGAFRSRFIGAGGSEFAESRPYQNEDYREIDWKTSAKKGETYAKKFELERDMPLILLVDVSRSGRIGAGGADKRAVIEDVAATLALAAASTNVRVGAVLFSDRVEAVIPARGGTAHVSALIDALMNADPAGRATDLKPALEQIAGLTKSRAMVAIVSDFLAPDFKDALAGAAARHDLRAIRVVDPAETRPLPDVALLPLVEAESGAKRTLDTGDKKVRAAAAAAIARREAKLEEDLLAARARPIVLSTEGDPLETLAAHFDPKGRNAAP